MKVDTIYRTDDWSALINTPYTRIELTKYLLENNGSTTQNLIKIRKNSLFSLKEKT